MNNQKNNAHCSICGSPYYLCMSCKDAMSIHPWKSFCDTSSHYQVFQIVRGYNTNVYTKDEARTKLKNIDLSDISTYREHIRQIIEDILKEENSIVEFVEEAKLVETKVEDVEKVEKTEDVVKTVYSRKRNYRTEVE